jgi:hypothetical protein
VVEPVATRPMRSVTCDNADKSVNGSNEVTVWLRFKASSGILSHEEGVELAAFQRLRKALEVREVKIGIRERAGISPCSGMDTRWPHESCEPELTWSRH